MKPLAILFLLIAIGCTIGGFSNTAETVSEKICQTRAHDLEMSKLEYIPKFEKAGLSWSEASTRTDAQINPEIERYKRELEKLEREREHRMLYFFAPAILFGIVGLLCFVKPSPKS